jgi:uncharacterized protein (UPF0548 family)
MPGPRLALRSVERSAAERRTKLDSLASLRPNFASGDLPSVARDPWHVDDYCRELPPESPGEPVDGGPFAIAAELITEYGFVDPSRVRAYYDAGASLKGRDMLLEIRYLATRVLVGVRVTEVFDELRREDRGRVRIKGWAYQTLEGHVERGQMDYQVWKWLDTGRVEFRIHAVSELAEIDDPFLRLGFRLVGRREQVAFARRCGDLMERLVSERLASPVCISKS